MNKFIDKKKMTIRQKIRHPFQIINISPYPFWIGFSLFWIILWFGLFYLNADWAKVSLKNTIFGWGFLDKYCFPFLFHKPDIIAVKIFNLIPDFNSWCHFMFETSGFDRIVVFVGNIKPCHFFDSGIGKILWYSSTVKLINFIIYCIIRVPDFIFDIFYMFCKLPESIIPFLLRTCKLLQMTIFDDILYMIKYRKISTSSLWKLSIPLMILNPLGCPFRVFTTTGSFFLSKFLFAWILVFISPIIFYLKHMGHLKLWSFILTFILSKIINSLFSVCYSLTLSIWVFFNYFIFLISFLILFIAIFRWIGDIIIEGARGDHTTSVQQNLLWGGYLFILSEVIIFITLFQTTLYFWVNPSVETFRKWDYTGIDVPYSFGLGTANLCLLLASGFILGIVRRDITLLVDYLDFKKTGVKKENLIIKISDYLLNSKYKNYKKLTDFILKLKSINMFEYRMKHTFPALKLNQENVTESEREELRRILKKESFYILKTIILGLVFMFFQYIEYNRLGFSISSGIYGTSFYCLTGLHGLHVIVGLILLIIVYYQFISNTLKINTSVFFWFATRYWQFVDYVWIGVWLQFYV